MALNNYDNISMYCIYIYILFLVSKDRQITLVAVALLIIPSRFNILSSGKEYIRCPYSNPHQQDAETLVASSLEKSMGIGINLQNVCRQVGQDGSVSPDFNCSLNNLRLVR